MATPVQRPRRSGFTLVEVMITLSVGVTLLSLAGKALSPVRENTALRSADYAIQYLVSRARSTAIERARAMDFDTLASGVDSVSGYHIARSVTASGPYAKEVRIIATGRSFAVAHGGVALVSAADTFVYQVMKP